MEVYKDVIGYEGIYQVSNLGNIKSFRYGKEKQMKQSKDSSGYLKLDLNFNGIQKTRTIHQLVAESFLNHKASGMKLVVNHIDLNKTNNNIDNLEIVTIRENSNRKHLKSTSIYTGVSWNKKASKWKTVITVNNKQIFLGYFTDELEASEAYQKALKDL